MEIVFLIVGIALGVLAGWLLWGRHSQGAGSRSAPARTESETATERSAPAVTRSAAAEPEATGWPDVATLADREPATTADPDPVGASAGPAATATEPEPEPIAEPTAAEPTAVEPAAEPTAVEPAAEPTAVEFTGPEPSAVEPTTPEPAVGEPVAVDFVEPEPAAAEPTAAVAEPIVRPVVPAPRPAPVGAAASEESEPADPTPQIDAEPLPAAPTPAGAAIVEDRLERIEGIGPKMAAALRTAGISRFADVADADVATLRDAIKAAGLRFAPGLSTWSTQARFLADGDQTGFEEYRRTLIAGRVRAPR